MSVLSLTTRIVRDDSLWRDFLQDCNQQLIYIHLTDSLQRADRAEIYSHTLRIIVPSARSAPSNQCHCALNLVAQKSRHRLLIGCPAGAADPLSLSVRAEVTPRSQSN
ncbi:hypothetical protein GOODEAATRI_025565 [Goodea atripinnis]|uniref:Uncharacterized protein n=1 Tax=Goodea atripinnis TaxID=208336 RepID=A0ABV0MV19_9TELE